jgi:hypothetical protein
VVRQQDMPFNNLEITGIEPGEVEAMEQRLKADILQVPHSSFNSFLFRTHHTRWLVADRQSGYACSIGCGQV